MESENNYENDFYENIFEKYYSTSDAVSMSKKPSNSNIFIFPGIFTYYNRWHQSINWSAIEVEKTGSLLIKAFKGGTPRRGFFVHDSN